MDVGIAGAEGHAPLGDEEVEHGQPVSGGFQQEQQCREHQEVPPGPSGEREPRGGSLDAPGAKVHGDDSQTSEDEGPHQPAIEGRPERELEHVEGHLLVEERVPDTERRGMQGLQDELPAVRSPPAGDERQCHAHGQGQPAQGRLQAVWAGQPERVVRHHDDVARGEPSGEGHVAVQDDEERGARAHPEEHLRPEHGDEHRRKLHLMEPEPVRVEAEDLASHAQEGDGGDDEEQQQRTTDTHRTTLHTPPARGRSSMRGPATSRQTHGGGSGRRWDCETPPPRRSTRHATRSSACSTTCCTCGPHGSHPAIVLLS